MSSSNFVPLTYYKGINDPNEPVNISIKTRIGQIVNRIKRGSSHKDPLEVSMGYDKDKQLHVTVAHVASGRNVVLHSFPIKDAPKGPMEFNQKLERELQQPEDNPGHVQQMLDQAMLNLDLQLVFATVF